MPEFLAKPDILDALTGAIDTGVCLFDRELRFRFITPLAASLNGLSVEDHLGRSLRDILPDIADALETTLRGILDSGETVANFEFPAEIPAQPGSPRFWRGTYRPLLRDGAIAGLICTFADVTAQIEAEKLRQATEARARRMLDSLSIFVGILSPDGILLESNRAPLDAARIAAAEVIGRPLWECYWWNHSPAVQACIRHAVGQATSGSVSRFDTDSRMAQGELVAVDFMLSPVRDEHGRISELIASSIDISQRKRSEEALRLSEERFRQVVEAVPEGLVVVNTSGQIELVNQRMSHLFGYERDELVGHPLAMLVPETQRTHHDGYFSGYMRAPHNREMSQRNDIHGRRKDGSLFPVEVGLNALDTSRGTMALATVADITRRRADQMLIERALEEKTVLLNEVHHRVKNNLQVISSLLRLQSGIASPEAREVLEQSQNRVRAMALIHQLLYERSDFMDLDFAVYCQQLCRLLSDSITLRDGVSIALDIGPAPVTLSLHRAVPCGLLVNELVTNAVKHAFPNHRGGRIDVRVSQPTPEEVRISVADNGIGLPADIRPGTSSTLGFQLIPLLVDQAGGRLELNVGGGTRFDIVLPYP
ncbi:hypothetical protein GCM10011289_28550 [Paludibacterium paludis]|uniref:Histidine kinase n=1 Tax=Paludibacterium paludis TaxID=1225769 RepID=A0A918P4W7_9NEIS|nr:hypothetical protein GCM10011289_28550 [Paludibacterium paludis]